MPNHVQSYMNIILLGFTSACFVCYRYKAAIYIRRKLEAIEHSAPPVALKDEVSVHDVDCSMLTLVVLAVSYRLITLPIALPLEHCRVTTLVASELRFETPWCESMW